MTAMLSHADTLISCGAFHLDVNAEDGQVIVSGVQPATREEQRLIDMSLLALPAFRLS